MFSLLPATHTPSTSSTMIERKHFSSVSALCNLFLLIPPTLCHMEMSWPYSLRSKHNPANSYSDIDYSMTSPLEADGSNFPCKGYQNDRPIYPTVTYSTSYTYTMTLAGSATHGGGSCQLSLSYDNGATFRVIKSMIGGCPLTSAYNFTIPSYAPTGTALLAWTWQNFEGNREFYMNCAEVSIISPIGYSGSRQRRPSYGSFEQLPCLWKANLAGINECVTTEGENPVYPHPGPDIVYGEGVNNSSTPTPGDCDSPTPYGQTYRDLGNTSEPASSPNQTYPLLNLTSTVQSGYSTSLPASTTTTTVDCPNTVTITVHPTTAVVTHTVTPVKQTRSSASHSWTTHTWANTSHHAMPTPMPPASGEGHPPYATGDVERYLPCVPGTFICVSSTTWNTCDYNDGSVPGEPSTSWVYEYPRHVAAGMECLGLLSPYSSETSQYAQQGMTPDGYYRDDRIVRARPDGDCSLDGAIKCTYGGQRFDVCDQGGWVRMGPVASGTRCANGQIVRSS